jgi:hypothetical protein
VTEVEEPRTRLEDLAGVAGDAGGGVDSAQVSAAVRVEPMAERAPEYEPLERAERLLYPVMPLTRGAEQPARQLSGGRRATARSRPS